MTGSSAYHLCLLSIRLFPSVLSVLLHIYVFCQFDCFLQSYQSCCVCRSSVFCHLYHHSVSSFSLVATQDLHLCIICVFCLLSSVSSCVIIQSCCRSRSSSVYHLRLLSFVSSCRSISSYQSCCRSRFCSQRCFVSFVGGNNDATKEAFQDRCFFGWATSKYHKHRRTIEDRGFEIRIEADPRFVAHHGSPECDAVRERH